MANEDKKLGDCYKVAFDTFMELNQLEESGDAAKKGWKLTPILLVHGATVPPVGPEKGKTILHAWVETAGDVLELSNGNQNRYSQEHWAKTYGGAARVTYSKDEAKKLADKHKHYGPWDI